MLGVVAVVWVVDGAGVVVAAVVVVDETDVAPVVTVVVVDWEAAKATRRVSRNAAPCMVLRVAETGGRANE